MPIQKIVFQASQVELSEVQSNEIYMSVLIRMFSTRVNRNGFAVTEGDGLAPSPGKDEPWRKSEYTMTGSTPSA